MSDFNLPGFAVTAHKVAAMAMSLVKEVEIIACLFGEGFWKSVAQTRELFNAKE